MRLMLVGLAATAILLSGCGSAAPASGAPTIGPSTAPDPTAVPGAVTAPPVGGGPLDLTALNIDFEPKELAASAGMVVIDFHNQDNGVPHNLEIKDASGTSVYQGEINTGPFDSQETMGKLAPGTYTYTCTVHPNMQGKLSVLP